MPEIRISYSSGTFRCFSYRFMRMNSKTAPNFLAKFCLKPTVFIYILLAYLGLGIRLNGTRQISIKCRFVWSSKKKNNTPYAFNDFCFSSGFFLVFSLSLFLPLSLFRNLAFLKSRPNLGICNNHYFQLEYIVQRILYFQTFSFCYFLGKDNIRNDY